MSVIPDNIRSQLAPGWSGLNIAIMIVALIFVFPLGVLMIGYILLGDSLGVDLGRPETFTRLFQRIGRAFDAGMAEFNGQANNQQNRCVLSPPKRKIRKPSARRWTLNVDALRRKKRRSINAVTATLNTALNASPRQTEPACPVLFPVWAGLPRHAAMSGVAEMATPARANVFRATFRPALLARQSLVCRYFSWAKLLATTSFSPSPFSLRV